MPITAQTLRLQDDLAVQLRSITDAHTRVLTAAWADAWDEVAADLTTEVALLLTDVGDQARTTRITRTQLIRTRRLAQVLAEISGHLTELARQAGVTITGDLSGLVRQAAAAQTAIAASQLPLNATVPSPRDGRLLLDLEAGPPADSLDAIVRRSTQQITSDLRPLSADAQRAVRRELVRGVAVGSGARDTALRIVRRAEGGFNGGLTRALVISRTETLDAHRAAAAAGQQAHAEVLAGWTWLAKLDDRTCRSCWAQHGRVHELVEPGPHDHQQGRCARMPRVRPWAELGITAVEPDDVTPDAEALFAALDVEQQTAILGAAGYRAWVAGDFPMGAWSQLRRSASWRDSYGVASAPATARRASASNGRQRGGRDRIAS